MKRIILAISFLTTTIIGVGIFSLPYTSAQSGFLLALIILIFLTAVLLLIHLYYGEIVLSTKEERQFPGYVGQYLGDRAKKIIGIVAVLGFYGAFLAYLVVGGNFLRVVLSPIIILPAVWFNIIFFLSTSVLIYLGIRVISIFNFLLGLFVVCIVLFMFFSGYKHIDYNNLNYINLNHIFAPYGAILFALMGMAVIPEIGDVLRQDKRHYKKTIIWGTLIPAFVYLVFIFSIVGITGMKTSSEAISGLTDSMGKNIVFLGSLLGFFTTFASYLGLGFALRETYVHDFKLHKNFAWFLIFIIPIILFCLNIRNFVNIICITGAFLGAFECTAIIIMHRKIKIMRNQEPNYQVKHSNILGMFMIIVFIAGLIYSLVSIL